MQTYRIFLTLAFLTLGLTDNCTIASPEPTRTYSQDEKELSQKADKYYSLAEKYYFTNPDSCLHYTLAYQGITRKLNDKPLLADALYWTSDIYFYFNLDSALYYCDLYLDLAKEINDSLWIAYGYYLEGNIYCEQGKLDRSLYSLMTALQYFDKLEDTINISALHNDIGYTLTYGSSQVEGLTHFLKSLELAEMINDTSLIADASTNLAYYFAATDDIKNAYKYSERSLIHTNILGDSLNILTAYAEMANVFLTMDRPDDARAYIDTALLFRPAVLSPFDKATVYTIFADFYLEWRKPDKAESYLLELESLLNQHNYPILLAYYQRQLGVLHYQKENYQKAISSFDLSITLNNSMNATEGMVEIYRYKAECYSKLNDFKNAYIFSHLSDSIKRSFHYGDISQLLAKREKELELKRQVEQDRIINELESLEMKNKFTTVLIVTILLIISFSAAIYSALRLKRKNLLLISLNKRNLEQKEKLEESLKELNDKEIQLTSLIATKDRLFSIIGHDLSSPLTVISRLSENYLQEGESLTKKNMQPFLEGLKSVADYGSNLLENLLQWSRSNTGDLVASPLRIKPAILLDEVLLGMKSFIEEKGLTLSLDLDKGCIAFADPDMVSTVLRNLIHNAIKFSHKNGQISVRCFTSDNEVQICVEDQGLGMSKEIKESILSSTDFNSRFGTNNEKGSGLGLVLCKEFIHQNNGRLWVSSEENKGSVFSFSLPLPE